MVKPGVTNRTDNDQDYVNMMLDHIEKKYDKDFEVVEYILPEEGFNSGQQENFLIVRDTEKGIVTDVYSYLSAPYTYYDNYVHDLASYEKSGELSLEKLSDFGKAKLHLYLRDEGADPIDTSRENVSRAVLAVNVTESPDSDNLAALYEAYCEFFLLDCEYKYFIVGFTEKNGCFDSYVESYRVFGVKDWQDLQGKVYATLDVKEGDLSFEEFKALCITK